MILGLLVRVPIINMIVVDSRKRKEMLMMKNGLKKMLAIALSGGVFFTSASTAVAASSPVTVTGDGGTTYNTTTDRYDANTTDPNGLADTEFDVQAQVIGGSEIVYSVKIEWGNMKFVYDYGSAWNPSTHSYARR